MSKEDLKEVAHIKFSFVHPDYRGNSFQLKLVKYNGVLIFSNQIKKYPKNVFLKTPIGIYTVYNFYLTFDKRATMTQECPSIALR